MPPCTPPSSATTACGAAWPRPSVGGCCRGCPPRSLSMPTSCGAWSSATAANPPGRPGPMRVALARYFEFYAGACDKLHGETIPYPDGYSVLTWREPHGVTGHIVPVELPHADLWPLRGRRPGGGQCVRGQAGRGCLPVAACAWPNWRPRWASRAGAINIVTGYGHEVGDALARHPGDRPHQLHRQPQGGHADSAGGCRAPLPGDAGAGRQEPADRLCRRRPGRRRARDRQRHRAERWANPARLARGC